MKSPIFYRMMAITAATFMFASPVMADTESTAIPVTSEVIEYEDFGTAFTNTNPAGFEDAETTAPMIATDMTAEELQEIAPAAGGMQDDAQATADIKAAIEEMSSGPSGEITFTTEADELDGRPRKAWQPPVNFGQ